MQINTQNFDAYELQEWVIGAILTHPSDHNCVDVCSTLDPNTFTDLVYRNAFKAAQECYDNDKFPDIVTVGDMIKTGDDERDNHQYNMLFKVAKETTSCISIKHHADKLTKYLSARRIVESINSSAEYISNSHNPDEVIDYFSRSIDSMSQHCQMDVSEDLLLSGSDGFDNNVDWLIKGWVPADSFGMVYGPSGSYKSFCLIDWAASIASGKDWSGNKVSSGPVLYIAAEGQAGVAGRVKAWEIINNDKTNNLMRYNRGCDLTNPASRRTLLGACDQIKKHTGEQVKVIIIDTVNRCFGDGDENSTKDMTAFVQGCDKLKEKTGATIICVHHTGKDAEKGARGSSVLRAACDFEHMIVKNPAARGYILKCTKAKEFEESEPLHVTLNTVDLGARDSEGMMKTSLARTSDAKKASAGSGVSGNIREIITDLLHSGNGHRPRSFIVDQVAHGMEGKPESAKQQVRREIKKLINDDIVTENGGIVHLNEEIMQEFDSGEF